MKTESLKRWAIVSFVVSMLILLGGGYLSIDRVPPYPERVVSNAGELLFDYAGIISGQNVYQRYGLMDHGSVWGHGTLRGPDFSALTIRIILNSSRDYLARNLYNRDYSQLSTDEKSIVDNRVKTEFKSNRYDTSGKILVLTDAQKYALLRVREYYETLFRDGDAHKGNNGYGFLKNTVPDTNARNNIADFFFLTSWIATTNRTDNSSTYTNNWPYDPDINNLLSKDAFLWSVAGIFALFAVLGIVVYVIHRYQLFYGEAKGGKIAQVLIDTPLSLSQYRAAKFFVVVSLLFIFQTLMGGLMAHYTTHPASFYIEKIGELIPYSWAKSWHLQLAIFWIATTWISASIYLSPVISGREPKYQGLLVNLLFIAVVIVAVGSLAGTALGVKDFFGENLWFWFGHQGWEYLELGRFWQILLFVGLIAWLLIVYRGIKDKIVGANKDSLVIFYVLSAILVVGFFGFGFFYGRGTNLTIADYWRWFVVHIWVEGIFEFFGVAIIAMFLSLMGLVDRDSALRVSYFTAILVFASGIIGTAHHYFWYGGPSYWIALGSVFSSLEPIPLIVLVVRAWKEYKEVKDQGEGFPYKWPFLFLVASSFWNFFGAGVFGFLINLPVVNYYEHGTYLTANHGHAALFGVYGMLSISLLLFSWRSLVKTEYWNDKVIKYVFWCLNGGLMMMVITVLFPVGIYQTLLSYKNGYWYARSPDFYNIPVVKWLFQFRIVPDTIIIIGAILLFYFLITTYPRLKKCEFDDGEIKFCREDL